MPDSEGYVMVLQPEEPKISLSGIDHFARGAAEFESTEGVTLFPELRIVSTITREVEVEVEAETEAEGEDDPTGTLGMWDSHILLRKAGETDHERERKMTRSSFHIGYNLLTSYLWNKNCHNLFQTCLTSVFYTREDVIWIWKSIFNGNTN